MGVFAVSEKYLIAIWVILSVLMIESASAQRPSFAGSRPPDGLSQKDKYINSSVATASASASATAGGSGLQNRFGTPDAPASVTIPFGQTQKPPVGLVVTPISSYVPLPVNNNDVLFTNRVGDGDANVISTAAQIPTATPPPGHPLDAHGDQQLIDKLNQLPVDKRPFWFINYQAIEAQRNGTNTNSAAAQAPRGSFSG